MKFKFKHLYILLSGSALYQAVRSQDQSPVVRIGAGYVIGRACSGSPAKLFQGIPYAQPPVKQLRFLPPVPFNGTYSHGVFLATKYPAPCIQFGSYTTRVTPSEDCLTLNVYVPSGSHPKNKKLPVKVWMFGGGNVVGDIGNPLYDACNLATDAIIVAFNYRLGPLGFLGLVGAGIKGNMALHDSLLALQWVKENIGPFGGDADKVMMFGQSAGADNVFTISALPQAEKLLSGVVLESGGGIDLIPPAIASYSGSSYAQTLGCGMSDLACLQSKSTADLVDAYQRTPALLANSKLTLIFGVNMPNTTSLSSPIIDGDLIKQQPLRSGSRVPILVGTTENENTLFVIPFYKSSNAPITEQNYSQFLDLWGSFSSSIHTKYPLSRFNTTGSTSAAVIRAVTHVTTTISYTCQAFKTLRAATLRNVPAFAYRFNETPSCPWLVMDGEAFPPCQDRRLYGSAHSSDLPYVFANLENLPPDSGNCSLPVREKKLSQTLVQAWTSMGTGGSPSNWRQPWPKFDPCEPQGVYIQGSTQKTELDFTDCVFWDELWERLGGVKVPKSNCNV